MGFYIERISDLQNDSRKGPVIKLVMFSLPVFARYTIFQCISQHYNVFTTKYLFSFIHGSRYHHKYVSKYKQTTQSILGIYIGLMPY